MSEPYARRVNARLAIVMRMTGLNEAYPISSFDRNDKSHSSPLQNPSYVLYSE